jgi:hypothetical protein
MTAVSKTDYLRWRECPKNAWLEIHKPDVFYASELTEFDKSLIDNGIEVEELARALFPEGRLIVGRDPAAQRATEELITAQVGTLFQPIFERDGYLAAMDVLRFDAATNTYAVYEIKSSTKLKDEHLCDVAFQAELLRRCRLNVDRMYVVHLNSTYVRDGDLNLGNLFTVVNVTTEVGEVFDTVTKEMEEARAYLLADTEPKSSCPCIYKGRSRHCSTFQYSNPQVPEYGVHDISRIGNSPKKLKEMVDAGVFALEKIPKHIHLSEIQEAQVTAYCAGETRVLKPEIRGELDSLTFPLHFIDYETCPSAIPLFDGYSPYQQIPFQYSLDIVMSAGDKPVHREFIHVVLEDPSKLFIQSLRENIGPEGTIIVWSKSFESGINDGLARRSPSDLVFITGINNRLYDLKDIFSKQYYVHKGFWGKVSIKNVLPVLAPQLSYSSLEIQEGGAASVAWKKIVLGELTAEEAARFCEALKTYCGMDSYAMYAIWRALREILATE